MEWYFSLPLLAQIFWACALIGSLIFLIQLVLTLVGMDSSDVEVDFDGPDTLDLGGGMSLFSLRALVNFLVGFGWTGVSMRGLIDNNVVLILVSVAVGLFFAWIIKMLWDKIRHLEHNGAYKIEDAVGLTATVYIPIPPARSGTGKVQISIGGSVQELNAVSDSTDKLKTGQLVAVDSVINTSTLLVKPC